MSLPMRINFAGEDYTYVILTKGINKATSSILIGLNGLEYELICNEKGDWDVVDAMISDAPGLFKVIGRNVKHRYRL